ncbi:hypothetical protein COU54_03475 [Candidatus Pacearchaeota archaeon CG10_big_fil_rev_8_21_14_0_10_31_24]|nr:MAG: hypothetical protein COU54_03475 [Candidatus Pacearchaeota archaeon CG10_big_fil_rev_8_21_14_0_10_31_24]
MEVNIIKSDKGELDFSLDNVTVAEVLRAYLSSENDDFAAWRREHPSKPVIFKLISEKGVSKSVSSAVSAIKKDCEKLRDLVKK